MKFYIDTEFVEGPQTKKFLGIPYGQTKPTIDLISIGIVREDGKEYYAVSKDFNLKEAFYRWDRYIEGSPRSIGDSPYVKEYWIRDNVLKPLADKLVTKYADEVPHLEEYFVNFYAPDLDPEVFYDRLKGLINYYGKSNRQIAYEVLCFISDTPVEQVQGTAEEALKSTDDKPEFYGYYADYDWVVFCWLFGYMKDLPKGFPMYCRDLKQMLDDRLVNSTRKDFLTAFDFENKGLSELTHEEKIIHFKKHPRWPEQENEHHALADACWNKKLHEFLLNN
jgi:hypothetical protein